MAFDAATALALGALQTWAFVHTGAWWLPLLCLAWLAWRAGQSSTRRAAWLGWLYGCGWLAAGVWWLFISMHLYGDIPAPLAAAAVVALAAALALYGALAMAAYARWRSGRWVADATLFAAVCLLAEGARATLFTGFPWLASGYSQVDSPLAAGAPWVGVAGMGAGLAWLAAALASGRLAGLVTTLVVLGLAAVLGPGEFSRDNGNFSVSLLQANVAQDEKFALERLPATLDWVAKALWASQADLTVTPETAVPLLPDQLDTLSPGYWQTVLAPFAAGQRAALVGVPLGDAEHGYFNAVVGLGGAQPYRYVKTHLVPFGEFVPAGFHWFTEAMNIPLGDFSRGPQPAPSFAVKGQRLAPNICYEDLFGDELALRFAAGDAAAPTVLVNLSNMGWFGDTVAVPQHLAISRLRALEFQRPMLRATNTGATAVIDHHGQVRQQLPPFTRGVLNAQVQGRSGLTPYAVWASRWGAWPAWLLAALVVLGAAWRRRAS